MSLYARCRDSSENGIGKYTIVAYRENNDVTFRGYVEASYDAELRCIECVTPNDVEEALVVLEKENLDRQHGQKEWVVRIYSGTDLTHVFESDSEEPDEPDKEVLAIDFTAIEARAREEHDEAQRTLMAVRIRQAHELAEKAAMEKEAKERSELRRLQEKYHE